VLAHEFAMLQHAAYSGQPSLFTYYGATNPAEFFAVATEVFFEQPRPMAHIHPALYTELASLYRVDPARWPES
jgi:Mlc titration factor MtfA (ptsG expression regulator)